MTDPSIADPGFRLSPTSEQSEPLISEVEIVFEPDVFSADILSSDGFGRGVEKLFGPGCRLEPVYDQKTLRGLAESFQHSGKKPDPKTLAQLRARGVNIHPAGSISIETRRMDVNIVRVGDQGLSVNVSGTSDDAHLVMKMVTEVYDQSAGIKRGWDWYTSRLTFRRYGTATVDYFPKPLRAFLSPEFDSMLDDVVEKNLAKKMVPERTNAPEQSVAFAKVMVHQIEAWVTVVESNGNTNTCRLEFGHANEDAVANRRVHVVSQMDYESHAKMVEALKDMLGGKKDEPMK